MLLFLSYADEDSEAAREIADRLSKEDISIYSPQDGAGDAGLASTAPECALHQADAFLALLSPDFLTSTSCRRERGLALSVEDSRHANGVPGDFVQVLKIRETPHLHAAALQSRPWFDLTGEGVWEHVLSDLASKFEPLASSGGSDTPRSGSDGGGGGHLRRPSPLFRNRERELDEICTSIGDEDGEHFWVVIAPPKLGKSWLLDSIGERIGRDWHGRFAIRLVDARELSAEIRDDADAILRLFFGLEPGLSTDRPVTEAIASRMTRNNDFHLCLLDSAELLEDSTVLALRRYLGEISSRLSVARSGSVRLALVAASRRESEWTGVIPAPRLQIRRLTEFRVEVIYEALQRLAVETDCSFGLNAIRQIAERVHALSEGLPALLDGCLRWIRDRGWHDLDQLEDPATFEHIARPYIERDLLSPSSLSARGSVPTSRQRDAIQHTLLRLSPYRFLTMSHLSMQTGDGTLQAYLDQLGWGVTDLWEAVSGADLLYVPLRQPWHEVYAPIRRLLCRHAYPEVADRSRAHRAACEFMKSFMMGLYGSDQCRALVECLWQETQIQILARSHSMGEELIRFGRDLSGHLAPVPQIDLLALRDMAARFIANDRELVDALASVADLKDLLVQAVREPM